jgi:hypothetical protein
VAELFKDEVHIGIKGQLRWRILKVRVLFENNIAGKESPVGLFLLFFAVVGEAILEVVNRNAVLGPPLTEEEDVVRGTEVQVQIVSGAFDVLLDSFGVVALLIVDVGVVVPAIGRDLLRKLVKGNVSQVWPAEMRHICIRGFLSVVGGVGLIAAVEDITNLEVFNSLVVALVGRAIVTIIKL